MSRPGPIWWGHDGRRAVGETWHRLKELAALRYGVMGRPDRPTPPFRLSLIRLDEADSHVMLEVIEKRLV
jgi:hypothetical protein